MLAKALQITREDYYAMPETGPQYQLIEGELIMAPAPNRYHQQILMNLIYRLMDYLEEYPVGKMYGAPFDVELSEINVFQPDISFFSNDRLSRLDDHGAVGAPVLVVEVLSPSTQKHDRGAKHKIYAQTGVQECWFVSPDEQEISIFFLQEDAAEPKLVVRSGETLRTPLLPEFVLAVDDVFRR